MAIGTRTRNSWMKRVATFVGGDTGMWRVTNTKVVAGPPLKRVDRIAVIEGNLAALPNGAKWLIHGVTSNERYTTLTERKMLLSRQPALGRPEATRAALIPVTKSESWWQLSQSERRAIFETRPGHIRVGLKYLPAIARRLYHCRDLGGPFDFLTRFEYAETDAERFEELVAELRRSPEREFVEREVDVRLSR